MKRKLEGEREGTGSYEKELKEQGARMRMRMFLNRELGEGITVKEQGGTM